MKGYKKGLLSLLAIFLVIGLIVPMFLKMNVEGMEPGSYPTSVSNPLLIYTYKKKKNPGLSNRKAVDNYNLDFPHFPAGSCGTNNVRYWRRPNNGTCSPPSFCVVYTRLLIKKCQEIRSSRRYMPRVNYYVGLPAN